MPLHADPPLAKRPTPHAARTSRGGVDGSGGRMSPPISVNAWFTMSAIWR